MTTQRAGVAHHPADRAEVESDGRATVYLDAAALAAPRPGEGRQARLEPGAALALQHLRDAGHPVRLTGGPGPVGAVLRLLRDDAPAACADLPPDAAGWLVTTDPAACVGARGIAGVRTILVGPATPGSGLAHRRSDVEARDLRDAILVILAAEAMPDARHGRGA